MIAIALALAAAAATPAPQARSFWKLEEAPRPQPVQSRVSAELVRTGEHLLVYRERGYRFSTLGEADEAAQIEAAVGEFDRRIYPRLTGLFGPCPDLDANARVILLLTRSTRDENPFLPFDLMAESLSVAHGIHSNEGEVIYLSFSRQGNLAAGNLAALAAAYHRLLHWSHDGSEVAWAELLGNYSTVLCGMEEQRGLWGDADHLISSPAPSDAWTTRGWPLLLLEYVRDHLGESALADLVARPEAGLAGLAAMLAGRQPPVALDDLVADFAMACWLDDAGIANGRFSYTDMAPPRPPLLARAPASRPTSSQVSCGAGGLVHIMIEGDGEHPLPLALRGDPRVRWLGRAVHLRRRGPDEELPLSFDEHGLARLELPLLPTGDGVVIAAVPLPAASPDLDRRRLTLLWGLGWVPRAWEETPSDPVAELARRTPAAAAGTARAAALLDALGGLSPAGSNVPALRSRYAWSPETAAAVELLGLDAASRGLPARRLVFVRTAPPDIHQDWTNVLIELPGTDERRWPVVVAAHWDSARGSLAESYQRALGLDENAAGVAVALEAAQAVASRPRRSPVLVALLAGGHHGAAGAAALLEHLQGRASAWIEIDGVGRPARPPKQLEVRVEGAAERDALAAAIASALRQTGLTPLVVAETTSPHTGVALAQARGIPAVVLRTHEATPGLSELDIPVAVEREQIPAELAALLGQAIGRALSTLAGTPAAAAR
jgi:hypothetical protein